jgi:DNA repair protein RadC
MKAGEVLGIKVRDHLILGGPGRFASLAEQGQL